MAAGRFGCTCRIEQLRVVAPKILKGFAFQDNDDEEVDNNSDIHSDDECEVQDDEYVQNESVVATKNDTNDKNVTTSTTTKDANIPKEVAVEDSDEEDAIEKPKVTKNVVRKKK
jgi:hypothetical protein